MNRAEMREELEYRVYAVYDMLGAIAQDFDGCYDARRYKQIARNLESLEHAVLMRGGYGHLLMPDLRKMSAYLERQEAAADAMYAAAEIAGLPTQPTTGGETA